MKYRFLLLICIGIYLPSWSQMATYDIVLQGGRVMDPATGLDAVRNVGISGDRIREISSEPLSGKQIIDVSGLVVAPGFIDLHVHGMTNEAHKYQVRDGVTTALELESGITFVKEWLEDKSGHSLVNFGASAPHGSLRTFALKDYQVYFEKARKIVEEEGRQSPELSRILINLGRSAYRSLSDEDMRALPAMIDYELSGGALAIGVPVGYYPGATQAEIFRVYELAAERQVPIFSHTRGFGLVGIQEAIANATTTGAPLHIVHANSLSLGDIDVTLDMVASAQKRGLDVTTEVYPYTAASTALQSALFDDNWQEQLSISYGDLQWEATGERLTKETFDQYRKQGGTVIIHMMKPEWIAKGVASPVTSIGSDGMPYAPGAHPRTAGTFSRVLGLYVREQGMLSLMEALRKMTIMPAQRLEPIAPMMSRKGRIQVGADADITVFDPKTVIDRADFKELKYSEGIPYVIVNGVFVVKENELVDAVFPGQPIVSKFKSR
ncbi:MAG: amidohydrolase family protein [Saprospiraceae bacterium]|nr:amidohydrolase family protein [Saprospiraceae bacterium]